MNKRSARTKFVRFFVAAVFSALASCVFSLGDTIIIGQYEGDVGIKALNLIIPIYQLFYALGLLFGMGAGIMISYMRGKNKNASDYFSVAFFSLLILILTLSVMFEVFFEPLMRLLGADESTMPYLNAYGRYVTRGALAFAFMPFINSVIRNDNAPGLVTTGVVVSCFMNVLLDYIFVFTCNMGMEGAGLATLICTGGQMLLSMTHLCSKKCSIYLTVRGLSLKKLLRTFKGGFSSFVAEICAGIIMVIMNRQLIAYIITGVEIYSVVANLTLVTNSILNGAAIASQPLISDSFGAQNEEEVSYYKKLGIVTVTVLAAMLYAAVAIYPQMYAHMFSSSPAPEFIAGVPTAIRVYMISLVFYGYNLFFISYFQAVLMSIKAAVLNFMRAFVLPASLILLLPLASASLIWAAVPISEAIILAIIVVIMVKHAKKRTIYA